MAYIKLEDDKGRIVRVPVFNESEDGSGDWHVPVCDSNGFLKINLDISTLLENPPTEDEADKAPTSEWAFDHAAAADAAAVSAVEVAGLTFAENKGVILDAALSADGKYSGIVEAGIAGTTLAFGDLVYLAVADSRWELTDADAEATAGPVKIGICVLAANSDGDPTTILLWGKVRADAVFPALTVGAPLYIGLTPGDIVTTAPSVTPDIVRIIGYGNTADELFFCPDNTYVEVV